MNQTEAVPAPEIVAVVPKRHPRQKYPWELWKDGQARKFLGGVHFHNGSKRFASAARRHAEERGLGVEASIDGNTVWLRFLPAPARTLRETRRGE